MTLLPDSAAPTLGLTTLPAADRTVLQVRGELDLLTADLLLRWIDAMPPETCRRVHLDLTDLTFADVVGVTALFRADRTVRGRAGRMTVGGVRPPTRRLLDLVAFPVVVE